MKKEEIIKSVKSFDSFIWSLYLSDSVAVDSRVAGVLLMSSRLLQELCGELSFLKSDIEYDVKSPLSDGK